MLMSLITIIAWMMIGICGVILDYYVDYINVPMIIFIALTPCLPFIFHVFGLF